VAKVVVTGGAGFIGSNLALRLEADGHDVKIYDNLSMGLSPLLVGKEAQFQIAVADILDFQRLDAEFGGADCVFHNAAIRSIPFSMKEPLKTSQANIMGTLNVLEASRKNGVKRVVLASSSSVYGNSAVPFREDMRPNPQSFYSAAKAANENHARIYHERYGLETVCLRYFNVFGYGQDGSYEYGPVIARFIHAIMEGKPPVIFGNGEKRRDFTFVSNVVEGNMLAMKAGAAISGMAFNIAQGESHSVREVLDELNSLLGTRASPVHTASRDGEAECTVADLSLSGKMLGYKPIHPFKEGLNATVNGYKKNRK
jgi:UDP-glucose 4-epimerase